MTYPLRFVNHSIAACRTRLYRRVKPTRDAPFDGCQAPIGLKPRVSQHFETNQQATACGRVFWIDVRVTRYLVATVPPLARALAGDHVDGEHPEHRAAELIRRARWAKEDPCELLGEGRSEDREGHGAPHGRTPRTERNHRSMTNGVRSMHAVKQVTVKSRSRLKRLESYLDQDRDKALDHGTQNLTRTGSARSCMREMDATRKGGRPQ